MACFYLIRWSSVISVGSFVDVCVCVFLLPPRHVIVYQPPASYYRLFFKWLQIDVLFIMLNIVQCNQAKGIEKESDMTNECAGRTCWQCLIRCHSLPIIQYNVDALHVYSLGVTRAVCTAHKPSSVSNIRESAQPHDNIPSKKQKRMAIIIWLCSSTHLLNYLCDWAALSKQCNESTLFDMVLHTRNFISIREIYCEGLSSSTIKPNETKPLHFSCPFPFAIVKRERK